MKNRIAVFIACAILSAALSPSVSLAGHHRTCGKLYKPSTQQWEHGCYLSPPNDPSKFIPDEVQPGQGGHSVWQGQSPSGPPDLSSAKQAYVPPPKSTQHRECQKVWSEQFKEYTEKCRMVAGGGPNTSIPSTAQPGQPAPAQPPQQQQPIDYQGSAQSATNLVNSIKGLFRK